METIKEEKKADLEQLLNSLIEKGWKVFGVEPKGRNVVLTKRTDGRIHISYFDETIGRTGGRDFSLRELVSKESGLWQFVCENNLAPIMCTEEWIKHYYEDIDEDNLISGENIQPTTEYEYRLIESSLKDESELEDFLLNSIKLEGIS